MKKKSSLNPLNIITAIGAAIIFIIIYTDQVSTTVVLPVLGSICVAYGIYGMVRRYQEKSDNSGSSSNSMLPLLQIVLGGCIIVIGVIETLKLNLSQDVWNILLVVMVVVVVIAAVVFRRK